MKKTNHTKGPWYVFKHENRGHNDPYLSIVSSPNHKPWAARGDTSLAGIWSGDPVDQANAQLMAAAPTMLSALKAAHDHMLMAKPDVTHTRTFKAVLEAIKLAEGE